LIIPGQSTQSLSTLPNTPKAGEMTSVIKTWQIIDPSKALKARSRSRELSRV